MHSDRIRKLIVHSDRIRKSILTLILAHCTAKLDIITEVFCVTNYLPFACLLLLLPKELILPIKLNVCWHVEYLVRLCVCAPVCQCPYEMCISVYVSVSVWMCISVYVSVSVWMCISVYVSVSL